METKNEQKHIIAIDIKIHLDVSSLKEINIFLFIAIIIKPDIPEKK